MKNFNFERLDAKSICICLFFLPFLVALLTPLKHNNKTLFYILALLVPTASLCLLFFQGYGPEFLLVNRLFVFELDHFSFIFVVLVNICWFLTIFYSSSYLRHHFQERSETFHRYLSASVALVTGAGLAGNFFTLVFFYLLSIPTIYPLIQIRGDSQSKYAGKFYLLSTLLPTLFIVIPTVTLAFPIFLPFDQFTMQSLGYSSKQASILLALLVIGFSKNCVVPFHGWLPASSVAPSPVTALVHSVAAVQTATIALLKITSTVYGQKYLTSLNDHFFETGWLTYLCGGTAIYSAYRAYDTPDLKKRFSFSTVGQLSYIITATLIGTKQTVLGAVLHTVTHSFAKLNLFFCAGIFATVFGTVNASDVSKFIPGKRWIGFLCAIGGLSITGFPLLAGYYSKDLMLIEELNSHHYAAAIFLVLGSIINVIYIFPIIKASFSPILKSTPRSKPVPVTMAIAVVVCTILIISFSRYVFFIMRMF